MKATWGSACTITKYDELDATQRSRFLSYLATRGIDQSYAKEYCYVMWLNKSHVQNDGFFRVDRFKEVVLLKKKQEGYNRRPRS